MAVNSVIFRVSYVRKLNFFSHIINGSKSKLLFNLLTVLQIDFANHFVNHLIFCKNAFNFSLYIY